MDYQRIGGEEEVQPQGLRFARKLVLLVTISAAAYFAFTSVVELLSDDDSIDPEFFEDSFTAGVCDNIKSKESCNTQGSCTWCVSYAIPSACYDLTDAKRLPNPVFVCDKLPGLNEERNDASVSEGEDTVLRQEPPKVELDVKETSADESLCDSVKQISGYIRLPYTRKNYFFWFFESRNNPSKDPVVVFLNGGPGCSSEIALFTELGPCSVDPATITTKSNKYSWNSKANLMFIDQPTGTGFSYGGENDHNEFQVGTEIYYFFVQFFAKYNKYSTLPLFLFGESYAGHYVPAIAHRIYVGNKRKESPVVLNLKGVGIGNGMTNPLLQFPEYPFMAYNYSDNPRRVSESMYHAMQKAVPKCVAQIALCNLGGGLFCETALNYCSGTLIEPIVLEGWNHYDLRIKCGDSPLCYDFSAVAKFLNKPEVRARIGVPPSVRPWEECSRGVQIRFTKDWMHIFDQKLPDLLNAGIPVLVYVGDADYICNWRGNKAWALALKWNQGDQFRHAKDMSWNNKAGALRQVGPFSFLRVYEAGHMVPMDQPKVALDMLNQFTSGALKSNTPDDFE